MTRNLMLVVSLDNPETLSAILELLEPFQGEISVSVRDNNGSPMMMTHVRHIGHVGHIEALDRTLLQELKMGTIVICDSGLNRTRLQIQEEAEIFAGNLKELGRSMKIDVCESVVNQKNQEKDDLTSKKQLQRWGSRQTNHYKSKVPRKFTPRTRKR